mgnify:CR=1 FL=1|tara:strand:+ start:615 stop:902 length:288 start_codon:yes stop_codon:yes gene_type:complete
MRLTTAALTGVGMMLATLMPMQVAAEAKIYSYNASANYCPAGLQPITISGVICCGVPNQNVSYQSMKAQPAKRYYRVQKQRSARAHCPAGEKGCS